MSGVDSTEPRAQWVQIERYWRDRLEESLNNNASSALDVNTLDETKAALRSYGTDDDTNESESSDSILDRLSPAFDKLSPFAKKIHAVSQYETVSALVWSGLVAVLEGSRKGPQQIVPMKSIELMIDLSESIPTHVLQQEDKAILQLTAVQFAILDIFEEYMIFCSEACSHSTRSQKESTSLTGYSRSPRGILEHARSRIGRHVSKLRDAVEKGKHVIRTQREEKITNLAAPDIAAPPHQEETASSKASGVTYPINTVNRARNGAFVGREDILEDIWTKVKPPDSKEPIGESINAEKAPTVCVLRGLGGVGKTQIALEYYYEHRSEYDATFWAEAEQDWTLTMAYARIADQLGILSKKSTDDGGHEVQNKAIEESRNWMQTTPLKWLLILDNVEDYGDIGRYMPIVTRGHGTIIITTQTPTVPTDLKDPRIIEVKALDQDTAARCIFRYLNRDPENTEEFEVACQLAEHVGCLPLAMATIGGYINQSQDSLAEFFENIKQKATLWEKAEQVQETKTYERSLESVFNKAFEDLKPASGELLRVLAFLDPDSIPVEIFSKAIEDKAFKFIHTKSDIVACNFDLRSRHLIQKDTLNNSSYISIHRVVQWNVLLELSKDSDLRWEYFGQAFKMVKAMLPLTDPKAVPEPEVWPPYAKYGQQILELRTHCLWPEPPVPLPRDFARIVAEMGTYMWFSGKFPQGEEALDTAERILDDKREAKSSELRAHIYEMQGIITSFEGVSERQKSMDYRWDAYTARDHGIGRKSPSNRSRDEDIMMWNMHSDMAFGFIQEEDWTKTADYMNECFNQYQEWEKDEMKIPFEYSKYYQLMAFCHMADGKPEQAIMDISRCLTLMQKAAGAEHSMVQLIKFCYANLLWHTKSEQHRQQALEIHKAVLAHRKQKLGEFSHFTLESYSTCGRLCNERGELDQAREHLETCLERRKRAVWNEEGITRAQFRHAGVLRAFSKRAQSRGEEENAAWFDKKAQEIEDQVNTVIQRYRKDYDKYMPRGSAAEDAEANLDQMVSIWAGRFTGGLKQLEKDPLAPGPMNVDRETETGESTKKRGRTE